MGGTSSSQQQQSSTTAPWTAAQPDLSGILGQLGGNLNNTGVTGAETGAINSIEANANNTPNWSPGINSYVQSLLGGGGANNQAPAAQQAFDTFSAQTNPLASNTNYDPMQTPGIADQLRGLTDQITQNVNGSFAAAGRDGSGYNQKALGQGLTAGLAPVLTNQFNANRTAQQGAAGNLYTAAQGNAGILSGLQQQFLANQGQGLNAAAAAPGAADAGANSTLAAEAARRGIPVQALGLLANIGVPIAGLGSQSTGQSNGTNTMSGAQQFGMIAQGIGNFIPKGPISFGGG